MTSLFVVLADILVFPNLVFLGEVREWRGVRVWSERVERERQRRGRRYKP
jgi:hypothetical protein